MDLNREEWKYDQRNSIARKINCTERKMTKLFFSKEILFYNLEALMRVRNTRYVDISSQMLQKSGPTLFIP